VHDVAGHYNRSDVYRLFVNNTPSQLVATGASAYAPALPSQAAPAALDRRALELEAGADISSAVVALT
jgi:Zn-dependent M28 family amino/carboxypeptidase